MKILYFSDSFGSTTTTFIRNEVEYFSRKHEVLYVASHVHSGYEHIRSMELKYEPSVIAKKWRWYLWKYDISCNFRDRGYARKLNTVIQEFSPDVIHCHFAYEGLKLMQNLKRRIPLVIHFHGYDASQMLNKRSYVKALLQEFKRHNATVVVVSDVMKTRLSNYNVLGSQHYLLRYGIDLDFFKSSNISPKKSDQFLLVQVSSLVEKKGHTFALEAIALALTKYPVLLNRLRVVFTGAGDRLMLLKSLVDHLNLSKTVSFVGNKSSNEVLTLLDQADAFIQHSVTAENGDEEGIPNAIMEAMAMELPILSTYHAGIPELVQHGVNGLMCNEKDVDTLADHIYEITKWKKLPQNRKVVENDYNKQKHNEMLEAYYIDMIEK